MEQIQVPVGNLTFDALADGPEGGPLVVLLHGFPQSSAEWKVQLDALARSGYRAVAPDQRGYSPGARPHGVESYAIEHLVSDVIAMVDQLGAHRFHLVGHDWGAIVAWHLAGWYPDRLRSLTIVSVPHPNAFARALDPASGTDQPERSSYIAGFKQPGGGDALLANLPHAFEASGLAGHDTSPYVELLSQPGAIELATNWYRAFDFHRGDFLDIDVPTLFVWGTEDPALGRDAAEWTEEYVTAPYRFEVLEGAPHWIPEAEPVAFTNLLLEHLETYR